MCVSMPVTSSDPLSSARIAGSPKQPNEVLSSGARSSRLATSGTVSPRPRQYCVVGTVLIPRIRARRSSRVTFSTTRSFSWIAGSSFSCKSITTSVVVRGSNSGIGSFY